MHVSTTATILGLQARVFSFLADVSLQAVMASIRTDDRADGMRNNFEAAAAHILPYDPVAKKRAAAGSKCMATQISLAEVGDVGEISSASKVSIGKSGVHLQYHTPNEYRKLNDEQKTELWEWRANTSDSKKPAKQHKQAKCNNNKTFNKKQVSAMIVKEVKKAFEKKANGDGENNEPVEIDGEEYIASMPSQNLLQPPTMQQPNPRSPSSPS